MSILKFLGLKESAVAAPPDSPETETVRRIVQQLDQLPPDRARYLASFAYLLSRAAGADLHISDEETRLMERIVAMEGGLPQEQALLVVQMAKTQHKLFGGTENSWSRANSSAWPRATRSSPCSNASSPSPLPTKTSPAWKTKS